MKQCELLLVGIMTAASEMRPFNVICGELAAIGVPVKPEWWGCQHAVASRKGLVVAVEYPDDLPVDMVIARIRAALDEGAEDLSSACAGIEIYNRVGWHLTSGGRRIVFRAA